mmetsp:Transcript_6456/g.15554  ORF Transcript_6456/g.15554 Transcript_6456/m.15554 type:complete len:275 (+) Transcript_6456:40-864(+)
MTHRWRAERASEKRRVHRGVRDASESPQRAWGYRSSQSPRSSPSPRSPARAMAAPPVTVSATTVSPCPRRRRSWRPSRGRSRCTGHSSRRRVSGPRATTSSSAATGNAGSTTGPTARVPLWTSHPPRGCVHAYDCACSRATWPRAGRHACRFQRVRPPRRGRCLPPGPSSRRANTSSRSGSHRKTGGRRLMHSSCGWRPSSRGLSTAACGRGRAARGAPSCPARRTGRLQSRSGWACSPCAQGRLRSAAAGCSAGAPATAAARRCQAHSAPTQA